MSGQQAGQQLDRSGVRTGHSGGGGGRAERHHDRPVDLAGTGQPGGLFGRRQLQVVARALSGPQAALVAEQRVRGRHRRPAEAELGRELALAGQPDAVDQPSVDGQHPQSLRQVLIGGTPQGARIQQVRQLSGGDPAGDHGTILSALASNRQTT
jgi:hypothetical protein